MIKKLLEFTGSSRLVDVPDPLKQSCVHKISIEINREPTWNSDNHRIAITIWMRERGTKAHHDIYCNNLNDGLEEASAYIESLA